MELTSSDDLRTVYRHPRGGPVDKVIHALDEHCVDFLAASPFFVLSSADDEGNCDGSPRGGPPGFVQGLDQGRLGWADYSGNNRLDSFENVVTNDRVALLFFIPGLDETLRVNGRASLSTDDDLCRRFPVGDKAAKVVVVVTVSEAYIHCAKSLRRGGLWDTDSWRAADDLPSAARIVKDHAAIEASEAEIVAARDANLAATLWEPGGARG